MSPPSDPRSDPAQDLVDEAIAATEGPALWVAPEGSHVPKHPPRRDVRVFTGRWELARALEARGWLVDFSDLDLSVVASGSQRTLLLRAPKEKSAALWVIDEAARVLAPGGTMVLIGDKQEGIRTLAKTAQARLCGPLHEKKTRGNLWVCTAGLGASVGPPVDHVGYRTLRPVAEHHGRTFWSKPGVFAWDRIDPGSALLADVLPGILGTELPIEGRVLDLGCGFGTLGVLASGPKTQLVLTDNNAAALSACRETLDRNGLAGQVTPSDAGDSLAGPFDVILSNAPFHKGFAVDHSLTGRFAEQAAGLLSPNGVAAFVVNQHVPLARLAAPHFADVQSVVDDGHYRCFALRGPR